MVIGAAIVIMGLFAATLALGWVSFGRVIMSRPPIGVMSLGDVAVMLLLIILIPPLYLLLPMVLVAALLLAAALSSYLALLEPALGSRRGAWAVALALLGSDIGAALLLGTTHLAFVAINNAALILLAVAIANLWVQAGLRARDVTVLGLGLAVYDVVATSILPVTNDLVARLGSLPLMPVLVWPVGMTGETVSLGLGDLLMTTTFPLVLRKAFSSPAGLVALLTTLVAVVALMALSIAGQAPAVIPLMAVLGPLMAIQYGYWRRFGPERTTRQFRRSAEGLSRLRGSSPP